MRYLRMLTNSLAGGLLGAGYLMVLLLQLNPGLRLDSAGLWGWVAVLGLLYGVHLAAAFYALMVVRQLLATEVFSPGWLSVRLLSWLSAALAAAASILMWLNLRGFELTLEPAAAGRMATGAAATAGAALVLTVIALAQHSSGRRGSPAMGVLLAMTVAASLALPLAARGAGGAAPPPPPEPPFPASLQFARPDPSPRVRMILLDGASLDHIIVAAAGGRLPHFGRILDAGASMHLATVRPTHAAPVWTAVATGKYPPKSGVRSPARYRVRGGDPIDLLPEHSLFSLLLRLGVLEEMRHTSASWRARSLWSIVNDFGLPAGIVRWPATYPAQPVLGYLVTDRFHERSGILFEDLPVLYPRDRLREARAAAAAGAQEPAHDAVREDVAPVVEATGAAYHVRDRMYARAAATLEARVDPEAQLVALRYEGLDATGHRYLRHAMPRSFGDVSEEERRRYGRMLDRYYAYIDAEVGAARASLEPDDLLLVVSGFGMEPVSLAARLLGPFLGQGEFSGTHERAPDGFLLGYGSRVAAGRLSRGSVVDVAPTVLYFLGLPVARDMDGYARTDMFDRAFTAERPITFIPTYETRP